MRSVDDLPARLRVARAHANLTLTEAGALASVSSRQWSRYENGDYNDTRAPLTSDQLLHVAAETGVPGWYMLGGWAAEELEPTATERLEALERRFDALRASTQADPLALFEQALPELVPRLLRALGEAPSPANGPDRPFPGVGDGDA